MSVSRSEETLLHGPEEILRGDPQTLSRHLHEMTVEAMSDAEDHRCGRHQALSTDHADLDLTRRRIGRDRCHASLHEEEMLDRHVRFDQHKLHGKWNALQAETLEILGRKAHEQSIANGRLLHSDHSFTCRC